MKNKFTLSQILRYKFDNTLSRGTISIIIWLAILSTILIVLFGLIYSIFGLSFDESSEISFMEALWQSLMRSVDPGTVAGDNGWSLRLVGFLITIGGIFILSTLIGILSSGLDSKLESLRKGRSIVIEENHTLILGWSSKIFHIISELIIANENQKNSRIVILADKDKIEMEDEIRDLISNTKTTRIICRTGSPIDINDLAIVNPNAARSIIILAPNISNSDTYTIKSVLALTHNPNRKEGKYHITAEIKEKENMEAAELVGNNETTFIYTPDLTARITAQTCRQSGLSIVYTQLLCFDGDEMYFKKEDSLIGKTYKEAVMSYNNSAVMGLIDSRGQVKINPSQDTILGNDDKILAISEDDDTVITSNITNFNINKDVIVNKTIIDNTKEEKNLILGWNHRGFIIVKELDKYVSKNSSLNIVVENKDNDFISQKLIKGIKNQEITIETGNISSKEDLLRIDIMSYDNIIILSYLDIDAQEADAKTLISLLHIRDIAKKSNTKVNIVSEMNILENRILAEVTEADDFIISENLISGMLSQLSESSELNAVFDDLFDSDGSEIYLKDAEDYISKETKVNFYTIVEAASLKGETAIGYRYTKQAHSQKDNYGVNINPDKQQMIKFSEGDKIIVLAED